jgi:hypothetical protein
VVDLMKVGVDLEVGLSQPWYNWKLLVKQFFFFFFELCEVWKIFFSISSCFSTQKQKADQIL